MVIARENLIIRSNQIGESGPKERPNVIRITAVGPTIDLTDHHDTCRMKSGFLELIVIRQEPGGYLIKIERNTRIYVLVTRDFHETLLQLFKKVAKLSEYFKLL